MDTAAAAAAAVVVDLSSEGSGKSKLLSSPIPSPGTTGPSIPHPSSTLKPKPVTGYTLAVAPSAAACSDQDQAGSTVESVADTPPPTPPSSTDRIGAQRCPGNDVIGTGAGAAPEPLNAADAHPMPLNGGLLCKEAITAAASEHGQSGPTSTSSANASTTPMSALLTPAAAAPATVTISTEQPSAVAPGGAAPGTPATTTTTTTTSTSHAPPFELRAEHGSAVAVAGHAPVFAVQSVCAPWLPSPANLQGLPAEPLLLAQRDHQHTDTRHTHHLYTGHCARSDALGQWLQVSVVLPRLRIGGTLVRQLRLPSVHEHREGRECVLYTAQAGHGRDLGEPELRCLAPGDGHNAVLHARPQVANHQLLLPALAVGPLQGSDRQFALAASPLFCSALWHALHSDLSADPGNGRRQSHGPLPCLSAG
ncbi:endochitinase A1 isoform X4 [Drosophila pseudoobscura]|nr:endochitinase A1 isoform X4 [Drosophila pseudoobscura]